MTVGVYKNKSVLVVGGTGFIGHHLVRRLLEYGAIVDVIHFSNNEKKINKARYHQVDISQQAELHKIEKNQFSYVFNLGGYINHSAFQGGGRQVMDVHFTGLMNLLSWIDHDILQGFVQIGSSDEYGDNSAPQTEKQREQPFSAYSAAKTAATHLVQSLYRAEGFPGTVLRLFLVYGPGQNAQRFLPQIIQACLQDKTFPVTKGEQLRDFCYVEDVVDAMLAAATCSQAYGKVINIGSGAAVSIKKMVETVVAVIGKGTPEFGAINYRKNENLMLYADIDKSLEILDWKPKTSLQQGLSSTCEWYAENKVKIVEGI